MSYEEFEEWFWSQPGNDATSDMATNGQYDEIVCIEYDKYLEASGNET